jgi:hypothetical protein
MNVMYLAVPPQPDCFSVWREAVRCVDREPGHEAHNVLLSVADPKAGADLSDPRVSIVNDFLLTHDKSIRTISNTIFPEALYRRYGAPEFFARFHERVLPSVRRSERWSGYYFERMSNWPGSPLDNPLWDIVKRMRDPTVRARNKFELALFDPARDLDRSPYGGQCLSFLSFKLSSATPRVLSLTAMYRNHYYVEKLLGNLIGLGQLMSFVASEAGLAVGSLTVLSSHAVVDLPKSCAGGQMTRGDLKMLLTKVDDLSAATA